ncbi:sigma-70 family RNA polymerase sigma factor [Achromobacter xylosoxidans]|uniref:RNA polymerase subunit sigma n=1 Tax=Alcaligenes xylosoxydans xylosoxydans TaxID=85698 RepID=A0A1R1JND9_ALCXX|nr:sigma-70 family RNA polymerase sigma factor [Achromobacter xylosoxidans]OMG80846.1 RNA polymerase subunit sigma [Achromobacter xylosoxidans]BEG78010.1 putative RNA polymerase sigma factor FecI [Achromobacter xylosoxidans]
MPPPPPPAPASFEALYSDHHGWLQNWLRRRLGNAFDAADLAHDTFLRVLRNLEPVREPRAYLATIAHGLMVNHWRRQDLERAYRDTLATVADTLAPSPEEGALLLDALCELDALLNQLNPKARAAFLLAHLEGHTYLEIAERLEVSERMVKKYMAQAMLHCLTAGQAWAP